MTAEAGPFAGLNVLKDANPAVIEALAKAGALLKQEPYLHKYPYDWRTKKPTIYRATEQWFASVAGFREAALQAIREVRWIPAQGKTESPPWWAIAPTGVSPASAPGGCQFPYSTTWKPASL
jgi:isoleucyl-tRNA synthetase